MLTCYTSFFDLKNEIINWVFFNKGDILENQRVQYCLEFILKICRKNMRVTNVIGDEMELKTTLTKILIRYKCINCIMHYVFVHNNVFIFSLHYLSPNLYRNIFSLRGGGGAIL